MVVAMQIKTNVIVHKDILDSHVNSINLISGKLISILL